MTVRNGVRAVLALGLSLFLAAPGAASASTACPGDDAVPTASTTKQATLALICDIDVLRARNGLPMLKWDWKLYGVAQKMASDLAGSNTFSHTAPDGADLYQRAATVDYLHQDSDGMLTENLGWGSGLQSSPLAIAVGWMQSDAHRHNILDPEIEDIGIGIAEGSPAPGTASGIFYVVDFGRQGQIVGQLVAKPQRKRATCSRARRAYRGRAARKRSSLRLHCARTRARAVRQAS